ncbi:hypothetical protein PAXRUDRAFT_833890 [Paxillus rubicundulus Ve08.2h10]|uniref:Uncharacterized protein n=1 Tax=Paxillus rubicundulus Ve08.2h10 TaxID=930991 RepID=A0A0D0DFK6_9AGAM|nr:hypothetical protein PAXRUDRAFT_833890 [Paxillus rubicundulus Ve08.2h10]
MPGHAFRMGGFYYKASTGWPCHCGPRTMDIPGFLRLLASDAIMSTFARRHNIPHV